MRARMVSTLTIRAYAKRLAAFALSLVFSIAALPAFAQQQTAPNGPAAPYGYGPMMRGWSEGPGWGWHSYMIVGPIFGLLVIIGMMAIFVLLVRYATRSHAFHGHGFHRFHGSCPWCGGSRRAALDILEERFARGEIDKAEFEDKRKLLGR